MPLPLAEQLDRAEFASLSLCRSGVADGWQASLEVTRGSFRIRIGETPSAAIAALFDQEQPASPPPLPY